MLYLLYLWSLKCKKQSKYPSTGEWISKLHLHPYNGILPNNKEEQTSDTHDSAESQMHYTKWKEPGSIS